MNKPIGLYIHVPFCVTKCPYCDFYSLVKNEEYLQSYIDSLIRALHHNIYGKLEVDSIYFGGGTPSLIPLKMLEKFMNNIRKSFNVCENAEITIEINPGTVNNEWFRQAEILGFNRLSIGVQSLEKSELDLLGRSHEAIEAIKAIEAAASFGFKHISADVMLAIPNQTRESLRQTLETIANLPIDHISAYLLKIEPNTPFESKIDLCPDEDMAVQLYLDCVQILENAHFKQYEISNFAKENGKSIHNLKYWQSQEYLGIGPSAHSYINGKRFSFPRDLISFINEDNPHNLRIEESDGGDFFEYAMLRLRLTDGLDLTIAQNQFSINTLPILNKAKILETNGFIKIKQNKIALTPKGFLMSNSITGKLLF